MPDEPMFQPDPFWKRSGFWAALSASVAALVAILPEWEPHLKALGVIIVAWGGFFTAAQLRPSVAEKRIQGDATRVMALLEEQRERIRALEEERE